MCFGSFAPVLPCLTTVSNPPIGFWEIVQEDQSKQHVALAAIGMRKVMSEELRPRGKEDQEEEEEGYYREEEEEEDGYVYRPETRRLSRGRPVSASPPPSAARRSRSSRALPR